MDKPYPDAGEGGEEQNPAFELPQQATSEEVETFAGRRSPITRLGRIASKESKLFTVAERIAYGKEVTANRNYKKSAENVRARWLVYEEDPVNDALTALQTNEIILPHMTCLDVGTADGKSLDDLRGWEGELYGLELNAEQYKRSEYWLPLYKQDKDKQGDWYTNIADAREGKRQPKRARFIEGSATDIPFPDSSVNLVTARYMLYHLKQQAQRKQALDEMHRVMTPDGVFIASTSGEGNKPEHRLLEDFIGRRLSDELGENYNSPPVMNESFTSEVAEVELLDEFNFVYKFKYEAEFIVDTVAKYNIYRGSILSMRDQFKPVPSEEAYTRVVDAILQDIWDRIDTDHPFAEHLSRAAYVCSDRPLSLPGAEPVDRTDG